MKLPRLLAAPLAAALIAFGFAPALIAQDPVLSRELRRVRASLPAQPSDQINFKNLDAAIKVLNGRIPSALKPAAGEAEYNSPGSTANEPQSPLDNLTRAQRADLVATYQLRVQNLSRATDGDNVSPRAIANIVATLEDLIRQLEQLASLPEGRELNERVANLTRILRPQTSPQAKSPPRPPAPRE